MRLHKIFKQKIEPKSLKPKHFNPKRFIALLLVALLLVSVGPGVGLAAAPDIYDGLNNELQRLRTTGEYSSALINQTIIDLADIENGSVATKTYIGASQVLTEHDFSVASQAYGSAMNKLTRFNFEIHNQYYPNNLVGMTGYGALEPDTVYFYVYGPDKDNLIWALTDGIPDCLNGTIDTSSGGNGNGSWIGKYTPDNIDNTISTSTFVIGGMELITATTDESGNVTTTTIKMDVAPYVKNDRTYMPVRYVANSLGVPDENITWDDSTQTVTMTNDNTVIQLTIGDPVMLVDDSQVQMDVVPEIAPPGRTMLPLRYVAEGLGADVKWDEENQEVIISQEVEQVQE